MICFSSGPDPSIGKDLPHHAARAVAFGLPKEEAVKALTINPAKILGIDDRVGSLEEGKDADIVILSAHPFDITRGLVEQVLIDGNVIYHQGAPN